MALVCFDTDIEKTLEDMENWDGKESNFADCIFGAMAHASLLNQGDAFVVALAGEVGASPFEVSEWAYAYGRPDREVQKKAVAVAVSVLRGIYERFSIN